MDQPFEYVSGVKDPASYIREKLESKPSGLRHLLRELQSRKRIQNGQKRDPVLLKEVSPSAFDRVVRRRRGEVVPGSLEKETDQERELRKVMRLND